MMSNTNQDWLDEIFEEHESLCSLKDGPLCTHCREAKQAINAKLLEVIGEDDEIYGVGVGSDEKHGANLLRAELRQALGLEKGDLDV